MGSVSMATNLKFEVFDMFNRKEQKMNPIGQAQCKVMELLMSLQQVLRLEIKYNGAVCGFLTVKAWRVSGRGRLARVEKGVGGNGDQFLEPLLEFLKRCAKQYFA